MRGLGTGAGFGAGFAGGFLAMSSRVRCRRIQRPASVAWPFRMARLRRIRAWWAMLA